MSRKSAPSLFEQEERTPGITHSWSELVKRFLPAWAIRHYAVAMLIIATIAYEIAIATNLVLTKGMIVYGNLPALYYHGPLNDQWLVSGNLFNVSAQLLSYGFGPEMGQNITYLVSLALPAFGSYLLLTELEYPPYAALCTSVVLSTIINPALFQALLTGSFTVFPWLFFVYLSFYCVVRSNRRGSNDPGFWILAGGVLYGLSLTVTNYIPVGFYLSFPTAVALLLLTSPRQPIPAKRPLFRKVTPFFLMAAFVTLPMGIANFGLLGPVALNGPSEAITSYVRSTLDYEYAAYDPFIAIGYMTWNGVNGFLSSTIWYGFSLMVLVGTTFRIFYSRRASRLVIFSWVQYLLSSALVILFHYGTIVPLFLSLRIFNQMEYPDMVLTFQLFSLTIMVPELLKELPHTLSRVKRDASATQKPRAHYRRVPRGSMAGVLARVIPTGLAVLLGAAILGNSIQFIGSMDAYVAADMGDFHAPRYMTDIQAWYSQQASNQTGLVLVLPNTYTTLNKVAGYLPRERFWNPPVGLPSLQPKVSASIAQWLLEILASENTNDFSEYSGFAGVQYVLLLDSSETVVIIPQQPPYSVSGPVTEFLRNLRGKLVPEQGFVQNYVGSGFSVYQNTRYYGIAGRASSTSAFLPTARVNVYDAEVLTNVSYQHFGQYPGGTVTRSDTDFTMFVNSTPGSGYSLLFFPNIEVQRFSTNPLIDYLLSLTTTIRILGDVRVEAFILYYDNSSAGFWSQFAREELGVLTGNGSVEYTLHVPAGTEVFRIVFNAWAAAGGNGIASVIGPQLTVRATSVDLAASPFQFSLLKPIMALNLVPSDTLPLYKPFFSSADLAEADHLLLMVPLLAANADVSTSFRVVPDNVAADQVPQDFSIASVVIESPNACGMPATVSTSSGLYVLADSTQGDGCVSFGHIPSEPGSAPLDFSLPAVNETMVLGFVLSGSSLRSGIVILRLPTGEMHVERSSDGVRYVTVFASSFAGLQTPLYWAVFPIAAVGMAILVGVRSRESQLRIWFRRLMARI